MSRLRNAGEESSLCGAVEGWILPATLSESIGGRLPLPTVRSGGVLFASISQNRLVMELRQAAWSFALRTLALGWPGMVCDTGGHFDRLSDRSNHSDQKDDSTQGFALLPVLASLRLSQGGNRDIVPSI